MQDSITPKSYLHLKGLEQAAKNLPLVRLSEAPSSGLSRLPDSHPQSSKEESSSQATYTADMEISETPSSHTDLT